MVLDTFENSLFKLKGNSVLVLDAKTFPEAGQAGVQLNFADGSRLLASYWRIVKDGKAGLSSFDHQQKYGLPATIDAIQELQRELQNKTVTEARLDKSTGDLIFEFSENIKFQVLNLTGYEVWEINFPDGTGEYSNYAK